MKRTALALFLAFAAAPVSVSAQAPKSPPAKTAANLTNARIRKVLIAEPIASIRDCR